MQRQGGAALIMGLLVLVVMILLTLTATGSTLMQNRMAGNFRDSSLAFQASEGASRWGMMWILSLDARFRPFPCAAACNSDSRVWFRGQYPYEPAHDDSAWAGARSYGIDPADDQPVSPAQSIPLVSAQPQYLIEELYFDRDDLAGPPQLGVAYYRVTSLGHSATGKSHAVLSAVLGKRYE
jgi:type IV pilus assembly protein PilX